MHILVCDDDSATRFVLRRLLIKATGCTVSECGDGAEALRLLAAGSFDAMVLDVEMPRMDGVEVLEAIRKSPKLGPLAVLMVSNERRADVVSRLVTLGICGYVLKPLRADPVAAAIDAMLAAVTGTSQPCR